MPVSQEAKDLITKVVLVVVLLGAIGGMVAYFVGGGTKTKVKGEIPMICTNPECKAEYLLAVDEFRKLPEHEPLNNWSPPTGNRHATYANISPGAYSFKLRACNDEGVWNEAGPTFSFTIIPPFWSTWWFRLAAVTVLLATIVTAFRIRMRSVHAQKRRLEVLVEARTRELAESRDQLQERREGKQKDFGVVEEQIRVMLRNQKLRERTQSYYDEIKERAGVEIDTEAIERVASRLPEPSPGEERARRLYGH